MTHKLHPQPRARARLPVLLATAASAVLLTCLAATLMCPAPARAGTVLKGIDDTRLFQTGPLDRSALMRELTAKLGAKVIRADLAWPLVEPAEGTFNDTYLEQVSDTVDLARSGSAQVVVTVYQVPIWASAKSFWDHPPAGYKKGAYQPFFPLRLDKLSAFQAFAQHLAEKLKDRVMAYECWCEPNLWPYIYPQRTSSDAAFAAHRYLEMLKAFSSGIRAGDPAAQVVAGATAPLGLNNRLSTAPQTFAKVLKAGGAEPYFDAYSHHPYTPGGETDVAPEAKPRYPASTVTLGNLQTLLRLFPGKPFYLTEYGYNTSFNVGFAFAVDQITQANYLRRAYAYVARFPQVQTLMWYPLRDWSSTGKSSSIYGVYSGLRSVSGAAKRAWYVYAGGNHLTIEAPDSVKAGAPMTVRGRLTCDAVGAVRGKLLAVQTRRWGTGWRTVATVKTGDDGACSYRLWPGATASFRLNWQGVVKSASHTVTVY